MRTYFLAAVLLLGAGAAAADESEHRISWTSGDYISTLGGYAMPDPDRGVERFRDSIYLGFIYGNQITEHFGVEGRVQGSILDTGAHRGSDFYQVSGTVDAVWAFADRRAADLTPFVFGGLGSIRDNVRPRSQSDASFLGEAGLGFVTRPLFWNLRLRGEGRAQYDSFQKGMFDFSVALGFEVPLGRVHEDIIVKRLPPEVKVREIYKTVVVPRKIIDSDGDGVEDAQDDCPDTPKGYKVDAHGCILPGQSIDLRGVTFESGSTRLPPNAQSVLDILAKALRGQKSIHVELAGYTDLRGSAAANRRLSQRRAETVRNYLIGQGVAPNQMTAVGYGATNPRVSPERTDADRELNRRVEVHVLTR